MPGPLGKVFQEALAKGLDMTRGGRLARAEELGHDGVLYHGTSTPYDKASIQEFREAFDRDRLGSVHAGLSPQQGFWLSPQPEIASEFAGRSADAGANHIPSVLPLTTRGNRTGRFSMTPELGDREVAGALSDAWDDGFDRVLIENYTTPAGLQGEALVIKNPEQIRSIYASYDPDHTSSPHLLRSAGPWLAGAGALGYTEDAHAPEHGRIRAPKHGWLSEAVEGARGLERRLEGHPAQLLYPEGLVSWLDRLSYGDKPTTAENVGALFDFL